MLPLRVLAVCEQRDARLMNAVFMVAGALDNNRPECALPLRIRVHAGHNDARTAVIDGELWIDVCVPVNADPLPMVVLEAVWLGLREAQARHPAAGVAFPVARARTLLDSIEQRMERMERREPVVSRPAPILATMMTAVFEVAGPGMPSFRVTRRRRR